MTRFFSWGPYTSIDEPAAYIAGLAGERERGERLDFVIVDHADRVLGVTGLSEFSRRDRRAVVGTWLGRAFWGTGANRAAKALIAALAFRDARARAARRLRRPRQPALPGGARRGSDSSARASSGAGTATATPSMT